MGKIARIFVTITLSQVEALKRHENMKDMVKKLQTCCAKYTERKILVENVF